MRKLLTIAAMLVMIPATAYAGGGGGGTSKCAGFDSGITVSMLDDCFEGTAHFAPTDTPLTISNDGEFPHSFTAVDGSFDSGILQPGQTFEVTLEQAGVIQFFCTLHGTAEGQGMAGVLVVGEAEPAPVSAPIDVAAIKQAVAEQNQAIVDGLAVEMSEIRSIDGDIAATLDRQNQAIADLADSQTRLTAELVRQQAPSDTAEVTSPAVIPVPAEPASTDPWIPLITGIAAGLALAAVYIAGRTRPRPETQRSSKVPTPAAAD